jgi:hypothetical protein
MTYRLLVHFLRNGWSKILLTDDVQTAQQPQKPWSHNSCCDTVNNNNNSIRSLPPFTIHRVFHLPLIRDIETIRNRIALYDFTLFWCFVAIPLDNNNNKHTNTNRHRELQQQHPLSSPLHHSSSLASPVDPRHPNDT